MTPRVLIVAGSDSGGGAGIQADIKTVTALGGYAATAITALTAQNTRGIEATLDIPADFVKRQMQAVLADIGADCIKTGMLVGADTVAAVADVLDEQGKGVPLVVDPVLAASDGTPLLSDAAREILVSRLLPRATVATPNLAESETLTGKPVHSIDDMIVAARALVAAGARAVVVTGGHLPGSKVTDVLVEGDSVTRFAAPRIDSAQTHGTGCTLASAIAVGLAAGLTVEAAINRARHYVREAIRTAPGLGAGAGPLNHAHTVRPYDGSS